MLAKAVMVLTLASIPCQGANESLLQWRPNGGLTELVAITGPALEQSMWSCN